MKKNILPLLFFLIIFWGMSHTVIKQAYAANSTNLELVQDVVGSLIPGDNTDHSVTFTLPYNASPVRTTDYIQIDLSAFYNVTAPTDIEGNYGGTPVFSVIDGRARVTGITLVPGYKLRIWGIHAQNPNSEEFMKATILISEDGDGAIIKNSVVVWSSLGGPITTVTASIDTPEARIVISGYAAPNTFVTFTEGGSVIGTDLSGGDGHFGKVFSGVAPGSHQIAFFGTDQYGLVTTPIIQTIYAPAYQETTVANQLLSPTIKINKLAYIFGEDIIATGTAIPNGTLTIFTEAPLRSYAATASANGTWSYTIGNTTEYVLGDYHIHALVQSDFNVTSLTSPSLGFTIYTTTSTGSSCGDISHGDLNCDGIVNLTDFSIIMYYWGTANLAADINLDKIVDLTDFSIMMYYWGSS
jgi:hypothetical protein